MSESKTGISLYFHIPFCVRKCHYCAFYSLAHPDEETMDRYLAAMLQQLASFPEQRSVVSVYFGGGTPSLFGANRLDAILRDVRARFRMTETCEITVEVNPGTVDLPFFRTLRASGVNRLSVGMQSASDEELRRLGRIHTYADVRRCVSDARQAGFDNISLDLLFALPEQTVSQFEHSLQSALSLAPQHLSVYSLQLEEGTAFFQNRAKLAFPSEEVEEAQYDRLCRLTADAGYEHYEISSFARDGKRSLHNLRYWLREDYLGIGAAAHSFWCGKRFSNAADLKSYLADPLHANDYRTSERIDAAEGLEESILLGLRIADGIPARLIGNARNAACIERMIASGLMRSTGDRIALTERGWRVSNAVIGALLV